MGSPLSPIVADIVLQDLESSCLRNFAPTLYLRYVDDILLSTNNTNIHSSFDTFNSYHPRLNFTLEVGGDSINFLDVKIIKKQNTIISDWYQKPTWSARYLNFHSNHPLTHKVGTIVGLVDRVILLSHPMFHKKNFNLIITTLLKNGYPLDLIFKNIKKRLHHKFNSIDCPDYRTPTQATEKKKYFTIPYINSISGKFKNFFRNNPAIKMAYTGLSKLAKFIKVLKDPLQKISRTNVVYKINCNNCEASYVGQTGRVLQTRINEHKNHIRRNTNQPSVITEHRINCSHDFNWEYTEILDEERNLNKRLISEMIHIHKQKQGLNIQSDTSLLDPIYLSFFKKTN